MGKTSLIVGAGTGFLMFAGLAASAQELPPGPNRALVYGQCRTCHDLQYLVESAGIPRDAWGDIIDSMKQYGLRLAPDDRAKIVDYLATYLGPHPPPAAAEAASASEKPADGAAVFEAQCSACHQPNGQGVAEQFPPLAGNRDLFLSPAFPALVVLAGLNGAIDVGGKPFKAMMPPFAHLSDTEVAAVVNYVRSAWGNDALKPADMAPIDAGMVAKLRAQKMSPGQVHARRQQLKTAAQK